MEYFSTLCHKHSSIGSIGLSSLFVHRNEKNRDKMLSYRRETALQGVL